MLDVRISKLTDVRVLPFIIWAWPSPLDDATWPRWWHIHYQLWEVHNYGINKSKRSNTTYVIGLIFAKVCTSFLCGLQLRHKKYKKPPFVMLLHLEGVCLLSYSLVAQVLHYIQQQKMYTAVAVSEWLDGCIVYSVLDVFSRLTCKLSNFWQQTWYGLIFSTSGSVFRLNAWKTSGPFRLSPQYSFPQHWPSNIVAQWAVRGVRRVC